MKIFLKPKKKKKQKIYSWVLKIGFVQTNPTFSPYKLDTFIGFILALVTFEKCGIYTCDVMVMAAAAAAVVVTTGEILGPRGSSVVAM